MKKQSGAIISVLGFLLFGMAASTIYFVSNGAGANSRLAKMRKQLDEQNKKSEAVAATLTEKEGRLAVMEKQHENLSSSRNKQHNVSTKNQLNIENQITALEAKLSKSKTETLSAQNELKHVLEQFNDVETVLKKQVATSKQKVAKSEIAVQSEKAKVAKAVSGEAEAREALLEASRVIQSLRAELAKLKNGNLSGATLVPSPRVPVPVNSPIPPLPKSSSKTKPILPEIASPVLPPKPVSPVIIPPDLPKPAIPKKTVIGRVAGIELKHGFILCQMSTVNGVDLGDSLIVTRRGEYIGLVRVSRADKSGNIVYAELNAAQLVKGIQEGDQVVLKQ